MKYTFLIGVCVIWVFSLYFVCSGPFSGDIGTMGSHSILAARLGGYKWDRGDRKVTYITKQGVPFKNLEFNDMTDEIHDSWHTSLGVPYRDGMEGWCLVKGEVMLWRIERADDDMPNFLQKKEKDVIWGVYEDPGTAVDAFVERVERVSGTKTKSKYSGPGVYGAWAGPKEEGDTRIRAMERVRLIYESIPKGSGVKEERNLKSMDPFSVPYCVASKECVASLVEQHVPCETCRQCSLTLSSSSVHNMRVTFRFECEKCGKEFRFSTCELEEGKGGQSEVAARLAVGMCSGGAFQEQMERVFNLSGIEALKETSFLSLQQGWVDAMREVRQDALRSELEKLREEMAEHERVRGEHREALEEAQRAMKEEKNVNEEKIRNVVRELREVDPEAPIDANLHDLLCVSKGMYTWG